MRESSPLRDDPPVPSDSSSPAPHHWWRLVVAAVAAAAIAAAAILLLSRVGSEGDVVPDRYRAQPTTEALPSRADSAQLAPDFPAEMDRSGRVGESTVAEQAPGLNAPVSEIPTSELAREALTVAERVAGRFPDDAFPHDILARAYFLSGDRARAEDGWNRCLELDSHFMSAYHNLAEVATGREDYAKVESLMRQALALDATSAEAQITLASALMQLNRFEEALAVANKCASPHPVHPPRGRCWERRIFSWRETRRRNNAMSGHSH